MAAAFEPDATSSQNDGFVASAIVALVLATVLVGVLTPAAPTQGVVSRAPSDDAACLEWSDGCRVCRRGSDGPGCSTPGIACVPAETRCLRRIGE